MNSTTTLANDVPLPNLQKDTISSISFSSTSDIVCCTSWDSTAKFWEVSPSGQAPEKLTIPHDGPLLCSSFSQDGTKCFIGGKSGGKLIDMTTGQHIPYAQQHTAPIKEAKMGTVQNQPNVLVTGSWDKTVKLWDCRAPAAVMSLACAERVYAMDVSRSCLTVGTAERHIQVWNLGNPGTVYKTMTSPLKHQTRCVANFIQNNGFAIGTVEGRVAIQYIEDKDSASNFTFKCHRVNNTDVYSVNAISFHPTLGTFSTGGGDGVINFWDKDSKQRLKTFASVGTSTAGAPITATSFNRTGNIFAYAIGYDWSKGHENNKPIPGSQDYARVMLHAVQAVDIEPRPNPKKR